MHILLTLVIVLFSGKFDICMQHIEMNECVNLAKDTGLWNFTIIQFELV